VLEGFEVARIVLRLWVAPSVLSGEVEDCSSANLGGRARAIVLPPRSRFRGVICGVASRPRIKNFETAGTAVRRAPSGHTALVPDFPIGRPIVGDVVEGGGDAQQLGLRFARFAILADTLRRWLGADDRSAACEEAGDLLFTDRRDAVTQHRARRV